MIEMEKSAEAYTVRAADMEISFRYLGDRWQHVISLRQSGIWFPLITSREGSPADDAASGPALQDLRFEGLKDHISEFQLLGQARSDVYSAAVRFDCAAGVIDFDVCARGRASDGPLCTESSYQAADVEQLPRVEQRQDSVMVALHEGRVLVITPVSIPDNAPTECRLVSDIGGWRITAGAADVTGSNPIPRPRTIRWRYRMTIARS